MRKVVRAFIGMLMAAAVIEPTPAMAFGLGSMARNQGQVSKLLFIKASHSTVAPFASVLFCKANPEECVRKRSRWSKLAVELDENRFNELQAINVRVNRAIRPKNDAPAIAGGDIWSLAPKDGDCEDYAITKRHELIARGWPSNTLRLGIAYTAFGEGHMVLLVRTTVGDLVLDNRLNAIRHWNKAGLRWVMIQSAANPKKWMAV